MKILIDKSFEKDTDNISDRNMLSKIVECINSAKSSQSLDKIPNLTKLKGFKDVYRIKIGNYRIGITINEDVIIFTRCLHRKDIYRYFPKK